MIFHSDKIVSTFRLAAQGVEPPVDRDENDFDPGAKVHVTNSYQYIL